MPRTSKLAAQPDDVQARVRQIIKEHYFGNYGRVLEALRRDLGIDTSRSAVQRYGKNFKESLARTRAYHEQTNAIMAALPPDGAVAQGAAMSELLKAQLFDALMTSGEGGGSDVDKLAKMVGAITKLFSSDVQREAHLARVRERLAAAADATAKDAAKAGVPKEVVRRLREQIIGAAN